MSTHERYDSHADEQMATNSTPPNADALDPTRSSNDLWQAFAASAGNAALRVVLTLAFALLVVVLMGQVSGTPAEAAALAAPTASASAASSLSSESASAPAPAPAPASESASIAVSASDAQVAEPSQAASDEAAKLASLPITPIALSRPPAQSADLASLRRGATMFATYCLACHAVGRVHFGQLRELGFSDADIAATLNPSGAPLSAVMHAAMPATTAEKAFGRAPPDLSLAVREKGSAWLYTYLRSFYMDPAARMGANNLLVPGVAMPNVLAGLQGERTAVFVAAAQNASDAAQQSRNFVRFEPLAPGSLSSPAYDQAIGELVAYMAWMADPHSVERRHLGPWVVGFLVLFSFCAWGLVRSYWRGRH